MFGYPASYNIKRSSIDFTLKEIIPAGTPYVPVIPMPDLSGNNIERYPIFQMKGYDTPYRCIGWGNTLKTGWEWYAFEIVDKENGIYFGYVMGWESEFGNFSAQELAENGIHLELNPKELHSIMPPEGWVKVN